MEFDSRMKKIFLLTVVSVLFGCTLDQQLDQWTLEGYEKKCHSFGFHPGTDAYSTCLMKQQELDANDLQNSMNRSESRKKKK